MLEKLHNQETQFPIWRSACLYIAELELLIIHCTANLFTYLVINYLQYILRTRKDCGCFLDPAHETSAHHARVTKIWS